MLELGLDDTLKPDFVVAALAWASLFAAFVAETDSSFGLKAVVCPAVETVVADGTVVAAGASSAVALKAT